MQIGRRIRTGLVLGAAAAGMSPSAQGTVQDPAAVEEIVVVAHKSARPVRDIAANVSVVSGAEIRDRLAVSIADVLSLTPGIGYEGGGTRFGTESINIRGIGGNRVAILVDGIPLSDQFDVGSFSNATRDFINAGFLERIEILHGPASAIYGSSAIGGVVALRSPEPAEFARQAIRRGRLSSTYGNADSSMQATLLQSLVHDNLAMLMGFAADDAGQYEPAGVAQSLDGRDYKRRSAMLKLSGDLANGQAWRLGYLGQHSRVNSQLRSMLGTGRFRNTTALEGDDTAWLDAILAEYRFGDESGTAVGGVIRAWSSRAKTKQRTLDERRAASRPVSIDRIFGFEQATDGIELNLARNWTGGRLRHRTLAGLEFRSTRTTEYRDGLETGIDDGITTHIILGEVFPLRDFPVSDSGELGIFVEDTLTLGAWTIIAGLRSDRYRLEPADDPMFAEDYPFAEPVSITAAETSPKLGLVYHPRESLDVYAQYVHGFRAPPYEDANIGLELPLFNYRAVPNPHLRSERSGGIDVGIRWRGNHATVRLSAFRTRYHDFIESRVRLGIDPDSGRVLFQARNLDNAVISGIETTMSIDILRDKGSWQLDASAYLARGENRDTGQPLNSVGPAQAVVGAEWRPAQADWRVRMQAVLTGGWSARDETRGALFAPPGHAQVDLYLARGLGARGQLRIGFRNLADRQYWRWADVRGLGPDDPVIPYMARPGRHLVAGLELNW